MESKNNQTEPLGFFHKFLNVLSNNYLFSRLRHHICDQSSVHDLKFSTISGADGHASSLAKDAATCNLESLNGILAEKEVCIVPEKELRSDLEDEPYLVLHQDASAVTLPIVEDSSNGKGGEITSKISEGATEIVEAHVKDEVMRNSLMEVEEESREDASSGTARTESGLLEKPGPSSVTRSQAGIMRKESTLCGNTVEEHASPEFAEKTIKMKVEEKADTKAKKLTVGGNESDGPAKSTRQLRSMRKPSSSNERSSVLIKRRKTTVRRDSVTEPMLP